uniref:Uncharacterized protein n=1 Tax=Ciona savignyi TaxID=51511 RepID=H2Y4J3_CIOSA
MDHFHIFRYDRSDVHRPLNCWIFKGLCIHSRIVNIQMPIF